MPETSRTLVSEDATRRVWDVAGVDGDGDPWTGREVELKIADPTRVLGQRVSDLIPTLRDGLRTFQTDLVAARWQTVYVALRVVLALARLQVQRLEDDE